MYIIRLFPIDRLHPLSAGWPPPACLRQALNQLFMLGESQLAYGQTQFPGVFSTALQWLVCTYCGSITQSGGTGSLQFSDYSLSLGLSFNGYIDHLATSFYGEYIAEQKERHTLFVGQDI